MKLYAIIASTIMLSSSLEDRIGISRRDSSTPVRKAKNEKGRSKKHARNKTSKSNNAPSMFPTNFRSSAPSISPSSHDSEGPSSNPSVFHSQYPTDSPTVPKTNFPSLTPTLAISDNPSFGPSSFVSNSPSLLPSVIPSIYPTVFPSIHSSKNPSNVPSVYESRNPTIFPSDIASNKPSTGSFSSSIIRSNTPSFIPTLLSTIQSPESNPISSDFPTKLNFLSTYPSILFRPTIYIKVESNFPSENSTSHDVFMTHIPSRQPSIKETSKPSMKPSNFISSLPTFVLSNYPSKYSSSLPSEDPTQTSSSRPSLNPTGQCGISSREREYEMFQILRQQDLSVDDPFSLHFYTFKWLLESDQYYICPSDTNLIQRFVIVLFHFEMSGQTWRECSSQPLSSCKVHDKQLSGNNFLSNYHECNWAFVICNNDFQIIALEIDSNNLIGSIPNEISFLSSLESFSLDGNEQIYGTIPTSLGLLEHLRVLDLDDNKLTGSIPSLLFDKLKDSLEVLDLNDNMLSGTLPEQLGEMKNLLFIQLHKNRFTGPIPDLSSLSKLQVLQLHENNFTGSILHSTCNGLRRINHFWVDCDVDCLCCTYCWP